MTDASTHLICSRCSRSRRNLITSDAIAATSITIRPVSATTPNAKLSAALPMGLSVPASGSSSGPGGKMDSTADASQPNDSERYEGAPARRGEGAVGKEERHDEEEHQPHWPCPAKGKRYGDRPGKRAIDGQLGIGSDCVREHHECRNGQEEPADRIPWPSGCDSRADPRERQKHDSGDREGRDRAAVDLTSQTSHDGRGDPEPDHEREERPGQPRSAPPRHWTSSRLRSQMDT